MREQFRNMEKLPKKILDAGMRQNGLGAFNSSLHKSSKLKSERMELEHMSEYQSLIAAMKIQDGVASKEVVHGLSTVDRSNRGRLTIPEVILRSVGEQRQALKSLLRHQQRPDNLQALTHQLNGIKALMNSVRMQALPRSGRKRGFMPLQSS